MDKECLRMKTSSFCSQYTLCTVAEQTQQLCFIWTTGFTRECFGPPDLRCCNSFNTREVFQHSSAHCTPQACSVVVVITLRNPSKNLRNFSGGSVCLCVCSPHLLCPTLLFGADTVDTWLLHFGKCTDMSRFCTIVILL